jgi:hypothetical protein
LKEEISPSIDGRAVVDLAGPDGERGAVGDLRRWRRTIDLGTITVKPS